MADELQGSQVRVKKQDVRYRETVIAAEVNGSRAWFESRMACAQANVMCSSGRAYGYTNWLEFIRIRILQPESL